MPSSTSRRSSSGKPAASGRAAPRPGDTRRRKTGRIPHRAAGAGQGPGPDRGNAAQNRISRSWTSASASTPVASSSKSRCRMASEWRGRERRQVADAVATDPPERLERERLPSPRRSSSRSSIRRSGREARPGSSGTGLRPPEPAAPWFRLVTAAEIPHHPPARLGDEPRADRRRDLRPDPPQARWPRRHTRPARSSGRSAAGTGASPAAGRAGCRSRAWPRPARSPRSCSSTSCSSAKRIRPRRNSSR